MPRDKERRRKSIERREKRREEHRRAIARREGLRPAAALPSASTAARWPLYECLISQGWQEEGALVQIIVARRSEVGLIAAAIFLVDLGCLGVKDAFARVFPDRETYESLVDRLADATPLVKTDLDTVVKVIQEAISYAERLGFKPARDFQVAAPFLEGGLAERSAARVPLGKNGRPFYVAGPHDNARKIVQQLAQRVGVGNFDFIVPLDQKL